MYGDNVNASGNIMTLLDKTGEKTTIDVQSCFNMLFAECDILLTAPALPATTLASSCYSRMFYNCTSLTQAPALPATTLAESCY
jgi:hypothetical protein